jgi:hypothetical protein
MPPLGEISKSKSQTANLKSQIKRSNTKSQITREQPVMRKWALEGWVLLFGAGI